MATVAAATSTSPLSFSGLATGLDTSSIVSQLVAIESTQLNQDTTAQTQVGAQQTAMTTLQQDLLALQNAAGALADPTAFEAVSATSSNTTALGATAVTGAVKQTYNVTILNQSSASQLTSGAVISSGSGVNTTVALNGATGLAAGLTSTTGSFTINGTAINYNTATDSLSTVLANINNSAAGVNAMYDPNGDKIILTNQTNGASAISVADVSGNLAAALNLTVTGSGHDGATTLGKEAQITIDGLNNGNPISSKDDIFTEAETGITGLTLTLNQATGNAQVTVGNDTSGISSNLTSFVTAYNAVQDFINTATVPASTNTTGGASTPAGPLAGNYEVKDLATQLRAMVDTQVNGLPSGLNYLAGLGIGTTGTSPDLSVTNSSALSSALANNFSAVKTLLTDPTNGIMTQLNTYLGTQIAGSNGLIQSTNATLSSEASDLTNEIAQQQLDVNNYQANLQTEFANMETAVSSYQGGLTDLLSALGGQTTPAAPTTSSATTTI